MRLRSFIAALSVLAAAPLLARAADDVPPGTPDDVAAIMRKMKSGGRPTPAEISRLQEWGQQLQTHVGADSGTQFGTAGATPTPEGIPVRLSVSLHTSWKSSNAAGTCDVDGVADGLLFATINGDGDYYANMLNPAVGISTFKIEPVPGGFSSGTAHRFESNPGGTTETQAHYTVTRFGVQLSSTGKDVLFARAGGFGGTLEGHTHGTQHGTPPAWDEDFKDDRPFCDVNIPFADEGRYVSESELSAKLKPGLATPPPHMNLSYRKLVAAIQSGKSARTGGTENFAFTRDGTSWTGTGSISMLVRPQKLELVIEPVDEKIYQKWTPMPDATDGGAKEIFGDPAPLAVRVALRTPGGEAADAGGQIDFVLREVSELKGVSMNYPALGKGDAKHDLFFLPQDRQQKGITVVNETHAKTDGTVLEATVLVGARDTGAYGYIAASMDSLGLDSINRRNGKSDLALPLDENGNHIGDGWEKDEGVFEKNLAPTWDGEEKPAGMGATGDGITLFDQYRGFVVAKGSDAEMHQRISPKQRTLFYFPAGKERALFRKGAQMYAAATELAVVDVQRPSRLAPSGDEGDAGDLFPRWVNFNQTPFTSGKAYALWLEDFDTAWDAKTAAKYGDGKDKLGRERRLGETRDAKGNVITAAGRVDSGVTLGTLPDARYAGNRMTPKTTQRINISRQTFSDWLGNEDWAADFRDDRQWKAAADALEGGLDLDELAAKLTSAPFRQTLVDEVIAFAAMHEMGHGTGAVHHLPENLGSTACPMLYWQSAIGDNRKAFLRFLAGRWDLTSAPDYRPWKFCAIEFPKMAVVP